MCLKVSVSPLFVYYKIYCAGTLKSRCRTVVKYSGLPSNMPQCLHFKNFKRSKLTTDIVLRRTAKYDYSLTHNITNSR